MEKLRRGICLLLCLAFALCSAASAWAENEEPGDATGILDAKELTERVESIVDQFGLNANQIAVGFYYSGSGDTYVYHGDKWMYSASLFKVPLYMALDDDIAAGKLPETGNKNDITVEKVELYRDKILINSVTGPAKWLMEHFGTYEECREQYRRYSQLPDDYFPELFHKYSFFSARFMIDVMACLLDNSDRYPKILDSLYRSPLRQDLQSVGELYPVAQKYGDYTEQYGVHHMAAIIDTPTPIAVVVMTEFTPKHRPFMNAISAMLAEYSLELDQQ